MKKKLLAIFLSVTMVCGLMTGCGKTNTAKDSTETTQVTKTPSPSQSASGSDGKWEYKEATLTFLAPADGSLDGFNAVAALAKEKLGITIETELRPGGSDGDNIVKTRLASGDMMDIMLYNSGSLLNALNPSEYFIDINKLDWSSRLNDTFKDSVSVNGATFGIPASSAMVGAVLYNKAMYKKYNLQVPKTWDEFIANCQVLKDAGETAVLGTFGDSWTSQVLFLGDYYNVLSKEPDFTKNFEAGTAKYASSKAGIESFKKYEDLVGFYNKDYLAATYDDGSDIMGEGKAGHWFMLTMSLSNIYSLYGKEAVDNIGVFAIPDNDVKETGLTVWMPGAIYGNKNSDKYDDIVRFMDFYTSEEALDAMVKAQLPEGPFCINGYELPDDAYAAVKDDMQPYFDAGLTSTAQEFQTSVKGANCASITQEVASGQVSGEEAAKAYDEDCYKQAIQLGLNWKK